MKKGRRKENIASAVGWWNFSSTQTSFPSEREKNLLLLPFTSPFVFRLYLAQTKTIPFPSPILWRFFKRADFVRTSQVAAIQSGTRRKRGRPNCQFLMPFPTALPPPLFLQAEERGEIMWCRRNFLKRQSSTRRTPLTQTRRHQRVHTAKKNCKHRNFYFFPPINYCETPS